ncbi:MAG TPA: penicillin acylase family protein [Vicinamibacterales bacterium]|nr:penicillin acylase family protein [Vicinamibacterales bacterium]
MRAFPRLVVTALVTLLMPAPAPAAPAPAPVASQTLHVRGLRQPVEIIKDRWGIAHIYAKNEHDLFFAQGYNAVRDRLFQFELWRRQATGTVAQILGPGELKRDIGTRLFMFRGDLTQELNYYHPHGQAIVDAYVDGVNAYVAEANRHPSRLPLEFKLLGIRPQPWTPAVVISRYNGLLANIDQELNLAQAIRVLGVAKVKDLSDFQPANPDLRIDPAIDLSLLSPHILDLYNAFREPIRFTPDEIVPAYRGNPRNEARLDRAAGPSAVDLSLRQEDIGSNDWVVSGRLTQTGFPIMANDPHRVQEAPSLRYWVQLVAPGWDVIGAGEPVLPGVSIGHNQYGAWGLTIFGNDSEDLYVYDTNPANPLEYRYRGGWETMRVIKDTIPVKGQAPVSVDLKFTRHGPVVYEDRVHHKAYAVRAAWMDIGSAPYLASLRMDQARTWQEFRDACSYSRIPSENMVWAGVDGTIGYQAVGIEPLRPNWSGLVPVPGDGRYEWDGYLPIKALPHVVNPAKGFYNTSNNYLFPPGFPYPEALHYLWADPYRAARVAEFLGSGRIFTVADMMALQNSTLSLPARSLVPLLKDLPVADPAVRKARDVLLAWNDRLGRDSVPAGIYEMWQRHLEVDIRNLVVPKAAQPFIGDISMTKLIDWCDAPDGRFGPDPLAGRDALLVRALGEAVRDLTTRLGPGMANWQLGHYHHALIRHPLSPAVDAATRARLDVGPLPRGGDSYTVDATGGSDNQTAGGSFKIIADTADWDDSVGINNPGQSGNVDSPDYRDLFPLWADGRYFPVLYSRARVESAAEERLTLEPEKKE